MTSQLIDLVNTTNNIVYENLKKLNSKFKKIQKNLITSEEEEYDSLNCKINIYFTTFIEQMKTKFILATQEYEKQIEQNNKDILDLMMENMLLKIEKDALEEKNKNDIFFSEYIDLTIQKEKNSINTNINKNLNNINKINSKKKYNKNNIFNNGIYSLIKSEFNHDNKNNNFSNNIYNYNLLDILNKNGSKKKERTSSYNKFNNNNYNFNFIAGLDLNHYNTHNKKNISYNGLGKALYDSQDNIKFHKNKNSFSLNDFRKIKNAFSQKRTKKNSKKNIKTTNAKIYNHTNENYYKNDNYQKQKTDAQNISFSDNKIQFTEPSYNEHNKKKEKINYYCIKKIKDEMNEILKNKKSINTSNNNSNINININTSGNVIDNNINMNKIKLPLGYNYYPKNKPKINMNNNSNKKLNIQNKTPKNIKTHKQANISDLLISDIYKDKNTQCKINYTIGNNNQKISPNPKKFKAPGKLSKINLFNNNINNNIYDNLSLNINNKRKDSHNNFSGLKNMKKTKVNNNINSKSYYKLNNKKNNLSNDRNKKNHKEKTHINNYYYNDNINNNISYNLANKNALSRNYSNCGNTFTNNTNTNYNTYYTNNTNYRTINNFNKINSNNIIIKEEQNNNITNINTNPNNNIQGYNYNNNAFSMKIRNRINLSKNKMNICLNNNNQMNMKNYGSNNISMSYLLNNKEIDTQKNEMKKYAFLNDENNKNETPSFYLIKK